MTEPSRPVLRWHGGKWRLAPWIISQFPPHGIYVEPYGGAGSVLIRKPRCFAEIYNDLDGDVVNLFRVLRSAVDAEKLNAALRLTPFAREEYEHSRKPVKDSIERARRLIVRSYMGYGSDASNPAVKTGFRANSNRSHTTPAHDWASYPDVLPSIVARLSGVVVECRPALQVMAQHDGPATLHYVDPPYMPETRSQKSRRGRLRYHAYVHEMNVSDHEALLDALCNLDGMVVVSGYLSPLYEERLAGWRRVERAAMADGARPRVEVLWSNPAAAAAYDLEHSAGPLFATG